MPNLPRNRADKTPLYCPNHNCLHHRIPRSGRWWQAAGTYQTVAFGAVMRFRCIACGKTFSSQTFSLDYYAKKAVDYHEIHAAHAEAMSIRGMSRYFMVSCGTIQNRLDRLGRQMLGMHSLLRLCLPGSEDICIDGFQSFDISQYHPNNYTLAITRDSRYALGCSYASLRRAGRMTPAQREMRAQIDANLDYEKHAVERSFRQLLDQLMREYQRDKRQPLVIISDEHKAYARAFMRHALIAHPPARFHCAHYTVNSKESRTYANPLFASNYIDREIRKDQAAHRRETACHCRNAANGVLRMWAYLGRHNYWKKFVINSPVSNHQCHGEYAGIAKKYIDFCKCSVFQHRLFLSRLKLQPWEIEAWLKRITTPRKSKAEYIAKFASG